MSCRAAWPRDFLDANFSKAFVNKDFKAHREQVLFEREQALLPASQHMVGHWNRAEDLRRIYAAATEATIQLTTELNRVKRRRDEVQAELRFFETTGYRRPYQRGTAGGGGDDADDNRAHFVRACPAADCRGFLSSAWKCGTCNVWVCPDCHGIKGFERDAADHECDPNDVATAQLLQRDTKPCPKCASLITKIDGCDQMWCVQCHTAFSWRTGRPVSGTVHNPHFYEWQRRQNGGVAPRVPGDDPGRCDDHQQGLPEFYYITQRLSRPERHNDVRRSLFEYHRIILHVEYVQRATYRVAENPDNSDLRLKYLLRQIDETEWKRRLQQREKKRLKDVAALQILEQFIAVGTEIFRLIARSEIQPEDALAQLEDLRTFANENIVATEKRFSMKIDHIPVVR